VIDKIVAVEAMSAGIPFFCGQSSTQYRQPVQGRGVAVQDVHRR
jgi:hypothetical protein